QQTFRREFEIDPPTDKIIRRWYKQLETIDVSEKGKFQDVHEHQMTRRFPYPPRSPDLAPCDFFLGVCEGPPVLVDLLDLRRRIVAAVESITPKKLTKVWEEFDYRLDVLLVTKGAHIEHL
ncbi:hypothetical protein L9F63_023486, partial [Diploptera punctata]